MTSFQPSVEDIRVEATWAGNVSSPVDLKILVDVVVRSDSHLSLIRNTHTSVLSTNVAGIMQLTEDVGDEGPSSPQESPLDSLTPYPHIAKPEIGKEGTSLLCGVESTSGVVNQEIHPSATMIEPTNKIHPVSETQLMSPPESAAVPFFAQTASLYEAPSRRNSALSPPLPPTLNKLTIPKRLRMVPKPSPPSDKTSPMRKMLRDEGDATAQVPRKRPISLDKRPPWRPVGAEDTTPRGRQYLGTDVAKRRISRSAGTEQVQRGRTRHRRSSLPGQMRKTGKGMQGLQVTERNSEPQTHPSGNLGMPLMRTALHGRDTTVKVTRYVEALNASEMLKVWLESRQGDWPADDPPVSELTPLDELSPCLPDSCHTSGPALSPSPTPSSCANLPWTSTPEVLGQGSIDKTRSALAREAPIPQLVENNGTIFAYFHGCSTEEPATSKFRIQIHASINLAAKRSGCHLLAIPGLPLQSGNAEGTFLLTIPSASSQVTDGLEAYEKIAYVDDDYSLHPLQHGQISHTFRLDTPFGFKLLCLEERRVLEPSEFEIDSDVLTRYDWEKLYMDGLSAKHTMICSLRLHPFLMWAEEVQFKLYLIGGPSGSLERRLDAGNRRIYLDGKGCDAEHELEISLTCSVADLQKSFVLSWEQSLGVAPFEVWLPRISGLYRNKLNELFDLPYDADCSIVPKPCTRSRVYSKVDQEEFLKASGEIYFFPENQHTPRTIWRSLSEKSGQFYDELTADYDISTSSSTPINEGCITPLEHSLKLESIDLSAVERQRTSEADILDKSSAHNGNWKAETEVHAVDATKELKTISDKTSHHGPKSALVLIVLLMLDWVYWLIGLVVAPVRLVKIMVLTWVFSRAFGHDSVLQLEEFVKGKAIDVLSSWDFEPVQLGEDLTGWKHLMAKVNQGAESVIHDGHADVLKQVDGQSEEAEEVSENIPEVSEDMLAKDPGSKDTKEKPSNLLDRIDLALGWRPPTGTW